MGMYYRKYFAGSVENANLTRNTVDISNNSSRTEYYVQSDVVCRAIKETLEDAGITCTYTSENSVLVIDGLTVQVLRYSSYLYYNANGICIGYLGSAIFSGNNYKFYITLKGDIDSVLYICVGYYSAPSSELGAFAIGKGKDFKDNSQIRVTATYDDIKSYSRFYLIKSDEILEEYKQKVVFGGVLTSITNLNNGGTEVTLVECVAQPGRFKLNNSYFGNAVLLNEEFYNIGGEIYYKLSNNILIKCVNEKVS